MVGIERFTGENSFLSNFFIVPVIYDGDEYPSSENAYQAAKTDQSSRHFFKYDSVTPAMAKRYGRKLKLRSDWNQVKDGIMLEIVRSKFTNLELQVLLTQTGILSLEEGNSWHDTYWGICDGHCRFQHELPMGENKLGKILERVRYEVTVANYRSRFVGAAV
jgi:ribA/ribD-fused uncharacterized protein